MCFYSSIVDIMVLSSSGSMLRLSSNTSFESSSSVGLSLYTLGVLRSGDKISSLWRSDLHKVHYSLSNPSFSSQIVATFYSSNSKSSHCLLICLCYWAIFNDFLISSSKATSVSTFPFLFNLLRSNFALTDSYLFFSYEITFNTFWLTGFMKLSHYVG